MQIETIDLQFQGTPKTIAAFLIMGPEGPVLIETGPATTLPTLLAELERLGVRPGDVRDVLVTHIHLDHAGAAGWWARQGSRVHVHPVGAPHLIDPTKLLSSATRIYGDKMEKLWGEVLSAPEEQIVPVVDGQRLSVGGLEITVMDTPGHAWHHHVYVLGDVAFTGDAAGIRMPDNAWIDLPAPPPEFNLEAWLTTLKRLREAGLKTLYRTHFGPGSSAAAELAEFQGVLEQGAEWIRGMLVEGLERKEMVKQFSARVRRRGIEAGADEATAWAYELANPRHMSVDGIARYWRKRTERERAETSR
jgi:glyoxylase-like metal-dependent hydrolase (beta-lactamase superfamily II)